MQKLDRSLFPYKEEKHCTNSIVFCLWTGAIPCLMIVPLLFFIPESPRWLVSACLFLKQKNYVLHFSISVCLLETIKLYKKTLSIENITFMFLHVRTLFKETIYMCS